MNLIWELDNWPNFTYKLETMLDSLSGSRKEKGAVITLGTFLELHIEKELLLLQMKFSISGNSYLKLFSAPFSNSAI